MRTTARIEKHAPRCALGRPESLVGMVLWTGFVALLLFLSNPS
jgi:hypothetical protein